MPQRELTYGLGTLYALFSVVVGGLRRLIHLGFDASVVLGGRGLSAAAVHKCSRINVLLNELI